MKLLIITDNSVWGGSEVLWYHLQKRTDVQALVWSPWGTDWLPKDVVPLKPASRFGLGDPAKRTLGSFSGDAVLYAMCFFSDDRLRQMIHYVRPLLDRNLPVTVVIQAVNPALWINDESREMVASVAQRLQWVFVSHDNAATVGKQLPNLSRTHVVYNIPFRELQALPLDANAPWAYVGRSHVESKGLDLLIESCVDFPVTVDLYGHGPNDDALREYARSLRSNVRFRGFQEDIVALWREHSVLLMCSRFEGTPLALMEAGLCGRPAVVTRTGGNAELVGEESGIVTGIDVPSIRAGMSAMLERSNEWPAMGAKLRERCLELVRADPLAQLVGIVTSRGDR